MSCVPSALRLPACHASIALLFAGLGACVPSAHHGVVQVQGDTITLIRTEGPAVRLVAGAPGIPLDKLDGYGVTVDGERLGRRLRVTTWEVTDGGDGSAPFVGILTRAGLQWELHDPKSGSVFRLVDRSVGDLAAHSGELVVVSGFVAGPHEINVVRWRALGAPTPR